MNEEKIWWEELNLTKDSIGRYWHKSSGLDIPNYMEKVLVATDLHKDKDGIKAVNVRYAIWLDYCWGDLNDSEKPEGVCYYWTRTGVF